MADWTQLFVIDAEAYQERFAIMQLAPELTASEAASYASESAYRTRFSVVATAAIRGDWNPAKELCCMERKRHGEEHARELMRAIQDGVRERRRLS